MVKRTMGDVRYRAALRVGNSEPVVLGPALASGVPDGRRKGVHAAVLAAVLAALVALGGQPWTSGDARPKGSAAPHPAATGLSQSSSLAPVGLLRLPAAARGLVSSALGADNPAYRLTGLTARNPAQHLSVRFTAAGAAVSSAGAEFTLGLRAVGREGDVRSLAQVAPVGRRSVVAYVHPGVVEQWQNGPLGLEQSFTVARRPAGSGGLSFAIGTVSGARMAHRGVALPGGLLYTGVRATDSRGRTLPARLQLRGGEIVIAVNDRGAQYPLHIDPFVQQAQLSPSDGATLDEFGYSVALDGSTIVVGAPQHTTGSLAKAGAVYVFQAGAAGWATGTQTAELTASDAAAQHELGYSVAISGNTIVAGAPYPPDAGDWGPSNCSGGNVIPGSAYEYTMPAGGWHNATQNAELAPSFSGFCSGAEFGTSVGISGATIAVGAPYYHTTNQGSFPVGATFVYTLGASSPTAILTASDGEPRSLLGSSVAISGNTIVAGDPPWNGTGYYGEGSAYVYVMPGGGWTSANQTAKLEPSDVGVSDDFGTSVAIDGDTVAVGAPFHGAGGSQEGAVYVFAEPGGGWPATMAQTSELNPSEGAGTELGWSVGISGTTVIGGPADDSGATGNGAAYVFTEPSGGWPATMTQTQELTQTPAEHGSYFGYTVAISGSTALVGAEEGEPGGVSTPPASGLLDVFGLQAGSGGGGGGGNGGGGGGTSSPPHNVRILNAKVNEKNHEATFKFGASGTVTGFKCALIPPKKGAKSHKRTKVTFSPCKSPKTYKHLKHGKYTFELRAFNSKGTSNTVIKHFGI